MLLAANLIGNALSGTNVLGDAKNSGIGGGLNIGSILGDFMDQEEIPDLETGETEKNDMVNIAIVSVLGAAFIGVAIYFLTKI